MNPLQDAIVAQLREHPRTVGELAHNLARHSSEIRQLTSAMYFGLHEDAATGTQDPLLACDPFGRLALRSSLALFPGFWVGTDGAQRGGRGLDRVLAHTFGRGEGAPPPVQQQGVLDEPTTRTKGSR